MNARTGFSPVICLTILLGGMSVLGFHAAAQDATALREGFANPPMDSRPQTRWWWLGNAITKEEITWQLREMYAQGLGGAEQITMGAEYEKGNIPYLSDEFFDLIRHAVSEAKALGMTLSLNFGGPGWIWGGDWIPPEERNQTMLASALEVRGPVRFDGVLPLEAAINPRDPARSFREILPGDRLIAVVAGRVVEGVLVSDSMTAITDRVQGRHLAWDVPEGDWRVMAFWSTIPEGGNAVNHIDKQAMQRYMDYLGQKYAGALGGELSATVESLFGDSFEVPVHRNGIYWADSVPAEFRARKGYDLVPHLPALWWEVGELSPKVRYDVNDVLHQMGMEAFFDTFNAWCAAHGVKSRVQPYGFVTDNLAGAGASDIPEMEITAGEKDAVPWFDTRIGPREYVASGAHLYGRNIVSVEAYTYLHWEPYRATLEELKITSDTFLRAGANRFNNHGFIASPERDIAPTRGFYAAIHISPDNVWWPYYRNLSDYIARSCYLLRQGRPVADIAIYAPTANQWAQDALNARSWTRGFDWGELGRLLLANGYQFDLVNDDALQRLAELKGSALRIGENDYGVLILPNIEAMPVESLRRLEAYAAQGGTVIALERLPDASCGMKDAGKNDSAVRELAASLFQASASRGRSDREGPTGRHPYGQGTTYFIQQVMDRSNVLDRHSSTLDPFLRVLRRHIAPDMAIDFVREDLRENNGLTFTHRRDGGRDIYFVTNIQDRAVDMPVGFRATGAAPWAWNPYNGDVTPLYIWEERGGLTWLPLRLAPFASTFVVFEQGEEQPHVNSSSLDWIDGVDDAGVTGWTDRAGSHVAVWPDGDVLRTEVAEVPAPLAMGSPWRLVLESPVFPRFETRFDELVSWTEGPETRHFSGTGVYTTTFELPANYVQDGIRLYLDLGDVGNLAEVLLNGQPAGVVWMRGQQIEISGQVRQGENQLEARVTNTLINRVAGLKEFPPVPEELRERLGRGLHDDRSPAYNLLGYSPLPRSGLLGPVEIRPYKRVTLAR